MSPNHTMQSIVKILLWMLSSFRWMLVSEHNRHVLEGWEIGRWTQCQDTVAKKDYLMNSVCLWDDVRYHFIDEMAVLICLSWSSHWWQDLKCLLTIGYWPRWDLRQIAAIRFQTVFADNNESTSPQHDFARRSQTMSYGIMVHTGHSVHLGTN